MSNTERDSSGSPSDAAIHSQLEEAKAMNRSRDYAAALVLLERTLSIAPDAAPVRAERARALFYLGRKHDAWDELDELASDDPGGSASCVKAELLLEAGEIERAAAVASRALNRDATRENANVLRLIRAKAWLNAGRLDDAVEEFQHVVTGVAESCEFCERLLERLRRAQRWSDGINVVDHYAKQSDDIHAFARWRVLALNALGRPDQALESFAVSHLDATSHDGARVKATLLCDIGDFASAVEVIRAVTEPIPDAADHLLALRGWIHQHLAGEDHIAESERTYRAAHQQAQIHIQEVKAAFQKTKAALQKAKADPQTIKAAEIKADQEVKEKATADLWYREGLAHALDHLWGRRDEAVRMYRGVIREIEQSLKEGDVDPAIACLAGWCCFAIGKFADAASYYSTALTMSRLGSAAEFDYALVLLALNCGPDALQEYTRVISSLEAAKDRNLRRRCGSVYVAYLDLTNASARYPAIASVPETNAIRLALLHALRHTLDEPRPAFVYLANRFRAFVESEEKAIAAVRPPDSPSSRRHDTSVTARETKGDVVVAFAVPAGQPECALLQPASTQLEPDAVLPLRCPAGDAPTACALYVTDNFLRAAGVTRAEVAASESLKWEAVDTPARAWAACTTADRADQLLNRWAARLVEDAGVLWARYALSKSEETRHRAIATAERALLAARDEALLYQAALLRTAVDEHPERVDLRAIREDLPQTSFFEARTLQETASPFRKHQTAIPPEDPVAFEPEQFHYTSDNPIVKDILRKASKISSMADPEEQDRHARLAAAGVQALIGSRTGLFGSALHEQVLQRLVTHDRFYLEDDESILFLARHPAFYGKRVLLNLSKPVVNCFAFEAATRQSANPLAPLRRIVKKPGTEPV